MAQEEPSWSKELQQFTLNALENLDFAWNQDGNVCFKHHDGRYGTISVADVVAGRLRVKDRETGAETVFANADELVRAGWAID